MTAQVPPTVDLLNNMDAWHPDILIEHGIAPSDYKSGLVFRSAVEGIRGSYIASSVTGRERLVGTVLERLRDQGRIADYVRTSGSGRYDFEVVLSHDPAYYGAIEVKGGEGNSINISDRPLWAREFAVWCHLDGAIVNQPAHGAHSVINRLTNELTRRGKLVDALFFKDVLCGTHTRPCPKYPGREETIGSFAAPDVFLFPQRIPTPGDPRPPVHTLDTLLLPRLILELFEADVASLDAHMWEVHVEILRSGPERLQRLVSVWHLGEKVDESISRPWRSQER
ncbi:MAG: hypothetical protein Kow00123_16150 [Anaerolineales bacterium]